MNNPLRQLWVEPRPPDPPVRVWRDWVILLAIAASAAVESLYRPDLPVPVLSVVLTLGLAPLVLWRRTHPLPVVAAAFGTVTVVDLILTVADAPTIDMGSFIYLLLLPYALFRWGSGREMVFGLVLILVSASVSIIMTWTGLGDAIGGLAVLTASFALGSAMRSQQASRDRALQQVKSQERVLLARELHDTVAHHVSAIAVQAQAGRALAATNPGFPVKALEVIEVEAAKTLAQMRTMVGVLRSEVPAEYAPQPGVADLATFAGTSPLGPRVEVDIASGLDGLPAAIDAAIYRIAQEAMTNALRHARHATLIEVSVLADSSTITLVVRDDGDPRPAATGHSAGFGLTGMAERATLLGGRCQAGPGPDRGWIVQAALPRQASA